MSNYIQLMSGVENLLDELVNDINSDVLETETVDGSSNTEDRASLVRSIIRTTVAETRKSRLIDAKAAYLEHETKSSSNVAKLPLRKKLDLVAGYVENQDPRMDRLTIAARNSTEIGSDLDSVLEDLVDLGIIDDEGNVL